MHYSSVLHSSMIDYYYCYYYNYNFFSQNYYYFISIFFGVQNKKRLPELSCVVVDLCDIKNSFSCSKTPIYNVFPLLTNLTPFFSSIFFSYSCFLSMIINFIEFFISVLHLNWKYILFKDCGKILFFYSNSSYIF